MGKVSDMAKAAKSGKTDGFGFGKATAHGNVAPAGSIQKSGRLTHPPEDRLIDGTKPPIIFVNEQPGRQANAMTKGLFGNMMVVQHDWQPRAGDSEEGSGLTQRHFILGKGVKTSDEWHAAAKSEAIGSGDFNPGGKGSCCGLCSGGSQNYTYDVGGKTYVITAGGDSGMCSEAKILYEIKSDKKVVAKGLETKMGSIEHCKQCIANAEYYEYPIQLQDKDGKIVLAKRNSYAGCANCGPGCIGQCCLGQCGICLMCMPFCKGPCESLSEAGSCKQCIGGCCSCSSCCCCCKKQPVEEDETTLAPLPDDEEKQGCCCSCLSCFAPCCGPESAVCDCYAKCCGPCSCCPCCPKREDSAFCFGLCAVFCQGGDGEKKQNMYAYDPYITEGETFVGGPDSDTGDKVLAKINHQFYNMRTEGAPRIPCASLCSCSCLPCCSEEEDPYLEGKSVIYHQEAEFFHDGNKYPEAAWLGLLGWLNTQDTQGWIALGYQLNLSAE